MALLISHPLADLFPSLDSTAFYYLQLNVHKNGVREPITLHEQAILDGRSRWETATALLQRPAERLGSKRENQTTRAQPKKG
jgi:hypothetical protein